MGIIVDLEVEDGCEGPVAGALCFFGIGSRRYSMILRDG